MPKQIRRAMVTTIPAFFILKNILCIIDEV